MTQKERQIEQVIFILGGRVDGIVPSPRFIARLEEGVQYFQNNTEKNTAFLVSGRCSNVNESYTKTEAQVGKEFILGRIPHAEVIKEDISVETAGNFIFSKPILQTLALKKVIGIVPEVSKERVNFLKEKIFGKDLTIEFIYTIDNLYKDPIIIERERKSAKLLRKLFHEVQDGDDNHARRILLYETPYYYKGIVDDKAYFDEYWEGGFDDFINRLKHRASK